MRSPTLSRSVMKATMKGWLMVWPQAIGKSLIGIGLMGETSRQEEVARHALHRFQHPRVAHALVAQHHQQLDLAGIFGHGNSSCGAFPTSSSFASISARSASIASICVRFMCNGVIEIERLQIACRSVPGAGSDCSRLKPSQ